MAMRAKFAAKNLAMAEIILAEADRYGGETAGLVQWARSVIHAAEQNESVPGKKDKKK